MSEFKRLGHTFKIYSFLENLTFYERGYGTRGRLFTSTISHEKMEWTLHVYNDIENGKSNIAVFLQLTKAEMVQVRAKYRFAILDVNSRKVHKKKCSSNFLIGSRLGDSNFVTEELLCENSKELLPGGNLTIYTEIDARALTPVKKFDLGCKLYKDRQFTDVSILVGDKKFRAHKAILATRSPVFRQMFAHDMVENKLNAVRVVDFEAEVIEEMLESIYTNVSSLELKLYEEGEDFVMELFKAADKYQIDDLKLECERVLYENLSVDSALQTLELADKYNSHQLKYEVLEFISLNLTELTVGNDAWTSVVAERPHFALDVMSRIVPHMSGPKSERIQLIESNPKPL